MKSNNTLPLTTGAQRGYIELDCIEVSQPLGVFYSAVIPHDELIAISYVDTRRIRESESRTELETLLGIQRELKSNREKELQQYVNTFDACFPTAVILSVPQRCAVLDETNKILTLKSYEDNDYPDNNVEFSRIASVLDGQHRIAGLEGYKGTDQPFQINVSIFLELDPSTEAYIFSVVNQAQTKVNKSLVYDLYSLATTRSPQRLCHQIAVTLNDKEGSPFRNKIKRLGSASPNTQKVSITQAAFVEALLKHISYPQSMAVNDRDLYMKGKTPKVEDDKQRRKLIFREMMIEEEDAPLTAIIWNYFNAVSERWPRAWFNKDQGIMLSKTNGFMALMQFLKDIYLAKDKLNQVISKKEFLEVLRKIDLDDEDFTVDNYKPGSSGQSALYRDLKQRSGFGV